MAEHIKEKKLLKDFTPKFAVGCRSVTPGDQYMKAMQEPNVDVPFTGIREVTDHGVMGEDGVEREVDTNVCATGFDISYHPHCPVIGRQGISLQEYSATHQNATLELPFHLSQTTSCTEVRYGQ
jgi:cation diffusion facilitator CzcD-associated flavoprotein CzcO